MVKPLQAPWGGSDETPALGGCIHTAAHDTGLIGGAGLWKWGKGTSSQEEKRSCSSGFSQPFFSCFHLKHTIIWRKI